MTARTPESEIRAYEAATKTTARDMLRNGWTPTEIVLYIASQAIRSRSAM